MTAVVSVDLALRRHADNGVVVLERGGPRVRASFRPLQLPDPPRPEPLAAALAALCDEVGARTLLLDGPAAWKDPHNGLAHARVCERALNTPAKTGPPGVAKPSTYLGFVTFCVAVFDALDARGWPRYAGTQPAGERVAVEAFPTGAWRALGLPALPAKGKCDAALVAERTALLAEHCGLAVDGRPSHDELQALVAALAGPALAARETVGVQLAGVAPFYRDGAWREGFIALPLRSPKKSVSDNA